MGKSEVKHNFSYVQVGAGTEETEGGAAGEQAERAGAEEPHLQPDQQWEEPETRSFSAQTVQHAASEQVSDPPNTREKACPRLCLWAVPRITQGYK